MRECPEHLCLVCQTIALQAEFLRMSWEQGRRRSNRLSNIDRSLAIKGEEF